MQTTSQTDVRCPTPVRRYAFATASRNIPRMTHAHFLSRVALPAYFRPLTFCPFLNFRLPLRQPFDPSFDHVHPTLLNPLHQLLQRSASCVFCHGPTPFKLKWNPPSSQASNSRKVDHTHFRISYSNFALIPPSGRSRPTTSPRLGLRRPHRHHGQSAGLAAHNTYPAATAAKLLSRRFRTVLPVG